MNSSCRACATSRRKTVSNDRHEIRNKKNPNQSVWIFYFNTNFTALLVFELGDDLHVRMQALVDRAGQRRALERRALRFGYAADIELHGQLADAPDGRSHHLFFNPHR